MNSRDRVMELLASRVGFDFEESELSPSLRRRVGEIEGLWEGYEYNEAERLRLSEKGSSYTVLWVLLTLVGIVVFLLFFFSIGFIILGALLLFAAYFVFQQDKDLKASIQTYQSEGSRLNSEIEEKVNVLSQEVFSELSAIHEARSRPVAPASPSQIVKETIVKEVVMISCAYCRSLMPQTSTFCPNCGARRRS